jgi:hypothetical protein
MPTAIAEPQAGPQVELARYEIPEGTRVLTGRRIDGVVHVYDFPVDHPGRGYFVESGFDSRVELAVLVSDYRSQAERLGRCPMGPDGLDHICRSGRRSGPKRQPSTSQVHALKHR